MANGVEGFCIINPRHAQVFALLHRMGTNRGIQEMRLRAPPDSFPKGHLFLRYQTGRLSGKQLCHSSSKELIATVKAADGPEVTGICRISSFME